MSAIIELMPAEREILRRALACPLLDPDRAVMRLCVSLQARGLLQRAGGVSMANGWRGSPQAFVLSRQGWSLLKAERLHRPIRRAG
jgi:hypothetical protein